jgi:anti-anti-sigma regulatory factor
MFVNNRSHNIHKLLDHHKCLGKREYSCLAKVEMHMSMVVVVVGQVVEAMEQMGLQHLMKLMKLMKHHNQLQLLL